MDGRPYLIEIGTALSQVGLEAVLIGNAAAALQGAPVTTVDFDFMFRKTPRNLQKLKSLAKALGAMVRRPYYPASDLYRVVRDDGLQVDFMATIHGIRSFEGLHDRAQAVEVDRGRFGWRPCTTSSRARRPQGVRATSRCCMCWRRRLQKRIGRKKRLAAVARESERDLLEMIRRWQRLPAGRRTNFLRKRIGFAGSTL
jgi:hypothetical protein